MYAYKIIIYRLDFDNLKLNRQQLCCVWEPATQIQEAFVGQEATYISDMILELFTYIYLYTYIN